MTDEQIQAVKQHFLEWSGGFEPDSEHQAVVYVDYARDSKMDRSEVLSCLEEWMIEDLLDND